MCITVPFPVPAFETYALCKLYIMKCACDLCLAMSRPLFPGLRSFHMLVYVCVLCCEYILTTSSSLTYVWEHYANNPF